MCRNVRWSARLSSLCRLKCFALQISSHACRVVCHSRYSLCFGSSLAQGPSFSCRSFDRHSSGRSSLTSVRVPPWIVRSLKLLIWTSSFRFSVAWVRAYLSGLLFRWSFVTCALPVEDRLPFRVRRVRLHHSKDVRTEKSSVAQSRISDRHVVSR